jgi:hypothetical protein
VQIFLDCLDFSVSNSCSSEELTAWAGLPETRYCSRFFIPAMAQSICYQPFRVIKQHLTAYTFPCKHYLRPYSEIIFISDITYCKLAATAHEYLTSNLTILPMLHSTTAKVLSSLFYYLPLWIRPLRKIG